MFKKFYVLTILSILSSFLLTSCFGVIVKKPVQTHEMGIIMSDGVSISRIVSAGRYRDFGLWAEMEIIDVSAKQLSWSDPDLWTKDKQPLSFEVTITYHRTTDPEKIEAAWETYYSQMTDDDALESMVRSRIPEAAKQVTVKHSLEGMLGIDTTDGGRDLLQEQFFEELAPELDELGCVLDNVSINNIAAAQSYVDMLQEKANSTLAVELATQKTKQLEEQLKQEQAQTEIDLEVARRENLVAEAKAKVYEESPQAYELKRLELLEKILSSRDKFFFIEPGLDLTILLSGENIIPVE